MNANLTDIENRLWSAADELRANSSLRMLKRGFESYVPRAVWIGMG